MGKNKKWGEFLRRGTVGLRPRWAGASLSQNHASVDLPLAPVHPPARQLVTGLERPDVLLAVAVGLGVQGPDNLGAVAPVAGPMGHAGFRPAEAVRRTVRIVAFIPGVADQDELAADVAGRKFGGAATAIIERLSGCGGQPAARVANDGHGDHSIAQGEMIEGQGCSARKISLPFA